MQYFILVASAALAMMQMATARNLGSTTPRSECGPGADPDVCVIFDGADEECHKLTLEWENLGDFNFKITDEVCTFYRTSICEGVAYSVNYPGYRHIEDSSHFTGTTRSIKCTARQ